MVWLPSAGKSKSEAGCRAGSRVGPGAGRLLLPNAGKKQDAIAEAGWRHVVRAGPQHAAALPALAAYARQRDDAELEVWTQEIKLRASVRIGELVRELDRAQAGGAGGGTKVLASILSKTEAIAEAGLSKPTAYRYQELAGPRDENLQAAGKAAAERYFAEARASKVPATEGANAP